MEEAEVPPAPEAEAEAVPKTEKTTTPELTESPELVATMEVELTTARAETEALVEAIKEVSSSVENLEGQEGTSKLIKVMLLGLKAQRSISQGGYIEMKQIAVKQLDLLRRLASGFTDQTDHLQQGERNEEPVLDSGRAENRWKRRKVRRGQLQGWQPASHLEPEFGRDP